MSAFNPLGKFDPQTKIDPKVIASAKAFEAKLPNAPTEHGLKRLYAHWTVAGANCDFTDYNGEEKFVGGVHSLTLEHNPLDEIAGYNNDPEIAGTWHRNTGSIACAITGMDGATENNFGPDPVTAEGLLYLCAMMAAFCHKYEIDANGKVTINEQHQDNNGKTINTLGEWNLLTHGEVAVIDAYPSERFDLGVLTPLPCGLELTPAMRTLCGTALRTLTHRIKLEL